MRPAPLLLLCALACAPAQVGVTPLLTHGDSDAGRGELPDEDAGIRDPPPATDAGQTDAGQTDAGQLPPRDAGPPPPPPPIDAGCIRPTALNTGVPAGTVLTHVSGDLTLSRAGAVVEALDVSGDILITASDVTVKSTRVHGGIEVGPSARRALIDHCDIGPDTGGFDNGAQMVGNHDFELRYSNLHNFALAVKPQSNVNLHHNYIHAAYGNTSSVPTGGVAGYGVSGPGGVTLVCNDIDMTTPAPGSKQQSANDVFEVTCTDTSNPPQGLILRHNWFGGAGYSVYIWGFWGTVDVADNVWDGHAAYGPIWFNGDTPLTSWTGNGYADGGVIHKPDPTPGKNCEG